MNTFQERIPSVVYRLRIQSSDGENFQLARAVLLNLGFKATELVLSASADGQTLDLFDESSLKFERTKALFKRLDLKYVKISQKKLKPKDWLTVWKKGWKPIALTKRLDVVPVWYQNKYESQRGRDYILMDTLLSFGTGLHETTQLMAQLIEDNAGYFNSFLDIGCGTGILSFVAVKNGAKDVLAIDIGQLSIDAAIKNMKVNHIHFPVLRADVKKFSSRKKFDFVAANLITEDLIEYAPKIIRCVKEDGLLALSGVSLENLPRIKKHFSKLPLTALEVWQGKQWAALLYQKKM